MLLGRYLAEHLISHRLERAGLTDVGFEGWLCRTVALVLTLVTVVEMWAQFTSFFHVFGAIPPLPWGG